MLEEAWNVDSIAVLNGSADVTYSNNLSTIFTDELGSPGTHIPKPLRWKRSIINGKDSNLMILFLQFTKLFSLTSIIL